MVSDRSRARRSNVLSMPSKPSQWSRWKCVMKIASSSASPTERSSCCCVPSPQSNSSRSPPARSSRAGSPRRAEGTDPAVPAKKSERSIGRASLERAELHELELEPPCPGGCDPHRAGGCPPALGRRARVEDLEAVATLVQRHMRVPEHDCVRAREAPPQPPEPPRGRPAVVGHHDPGALRLDQPDRG